MQDTLPRQRNSADRYPELAASSRDRLLTRPEVEVETGLSRTSIYRKMEEGTFPRPKRISQRAVRWPQSKIDAWKANQPEAEPLV